MSKTKNIKKGKKPYVYLSLKRIGSVVLEYIVGQTENSM